MKVCIFSRPIASMNASLLSNKIHFQYNIKKKEELVEQQPQEEPNPLMRKKKTPEELAAEAEQEDLDDFTSKKHNYLSFVPQLFCFHFIVEVRWITAYGILAYYSVQRALFSQIVRAHEWQKVDISWHFSSPSTNIHLNTLDLVVNEKKKNIHEDFGWK